MKNKALKLAKLLLNLGPMYCDTPCNWMFFKYMKLICEKLVRQIIF